MKLNGMERKEEKSERMNKMRKATNTTIELNNWIYVPNTDFSQRNFEHFVCEFLHSFAFCVLVREK